MKKYKIMSTAYICLLMLFFYSNVFSQNVQVSERLANKINSLNPIQYTGVLILLKNQVDIEKLDKDPVRIDFY